MIINKARVAVALLLLTGCAVSSGTVHAPKSGQKIQVVAIENVWGSIAEQIGGSHVAVTSILNDPNADPHTFETDAKTAASVSSAYYVIENGLGYDDFADKLLKSNPAKGRQVLNVAKVVAAPADGNPHLWYDPGYVKSVADTLRDAFGKIDPADSAEFIANTEAFEKAYGEYSVLLAEIKARYAGAPIAYTERVPGYLVQAAGLTLATPASFAQSVEDGDDPSIADTDAMDTAMTKKTVKVLFYNAQVTSPVTDHVKKLAQQSGVPVVGVAETIPASYPTFQAWQIAQARAVLAALAG